MDGERWVGMDSLRQKISGSKAYEMSFLQEDNGLVCTDSRPGCRDEVCAGLEDVGFDCSITLLSLFVIYDYLVADRH